MDFTRASRTKNLIGAYLSHLGIYNSMHGGNLEFYELNINSFSKNEKVRK